MLLAHGCGSARRLTDGFGRFVVSGGQLILLFIGFGLAYVDTAHWTPFIPENTGKFGQFGLSREC